MTHHLSSHSNEGNGLALVGFSLLWVLLALPVAIAVVASTAYEAYLLWSVAGLIALPVLLATPLVLGFLAWRDRD